MPTFII